MDTERLVFIIAANPTRDLEAEDALTRDLARSGGDGLTACKQDAGACPKPCLRHRRVNVGIWPNWRMRESFVDWQMWGHDCPDVRPRGMSPDCGTYQDHLAREELKRETAAYIQNRRNQEWDYDPYATPPIFWSNAPRVPPDVDHLAAVFGLNDAQALQLFAMARQARNISDNMGISPLWDRESARLPIIDPPPQTWSSRLPISSQFEKPWWAQYYKLERVAITDLSSVESHQPSAAPQPSLDASPRQPSPDSEA